MAEEWDDLIIISDDESNDYENRTNMIDRRSLVDPIAACKAQVVAVFPDICPEYLDGLAQRYGNDSSTLIATILDEVDNGIAMPIRQRSLLKRKRDQEGEEEHGAEKLARTYSDTNRHTELRNAAYVIQATQLLMQAFPRVHASNVGKVLKSNQNCLFPAYLELSGETGRALSLKKSNTKYREGFQRLEIDGTIEKEVDPHKRLALQEFKAAQWTVDTQTAKAEAEERRKREEADNLDRARADGTIGECECCCDDFALNRMVHCNGNIIHWFCTACARRAAETEVGMSKYELMCMSMDGCTAGFSRDQRDIFLDDNLTIALERIEQEAVLRLAGIENLETCPFCPYAAEYPPVGEDKEFRCLKPDCEKVSCRLCRRETHIPKSCHEATQEAGQSARRVIEEAMSAAMIRKCNQCNTPFIKENGCNKMTCTRNGCRNVQCYVCGKSCEYNHFNDLSRGGKAGNCPLWDSAEQRHEAEVKQAEEEARNKVLEENPDVDAEVFKIKVSDKVKEDEDRRKIAAATAVQPYLPRAAPVPNPQASEARRRAQMAQLQRYQRLQRDILKPFHPMTLDNAAFGRALGFLEMDMDKPLPVIQARNEAPAVPQMPQLGYGLHMDDFFPLIPPQIVNPAHVARQPLVVNSLAVQAEIQALAGRDLHLSRNYLETLRQSPADIALGRKDLEDRAHAQQQARQHGQQHGQEQGRQHGQDHIHSQQEPLQHADQHRAAFAPRPPQPQVRQPEVDWRNRFQFHQEAHQAALAGEPQRVHHKNLPHVSNLPVTPEAFARSLFALSNQDPVLALAPQPMTRGGARTPAQPSRAASDRPPNVARRV